MLLSEEKISHLAHRILDGLSEELDLAWRVEEGEVLREIKKAIVAELRLEEEIDHQVRRGELVAKEIVVAVVSF